MLKNSENFSFIPMGKYLFCGDMVQDLLWKKPLLPLFGNDKGLRSWKKVIKEGYSRIYPATGNYVHVEGIRKVVEKYEKY